MGKLTLLFSKVLADDTLKLSDEQYKVIDEVCNSLPFKLTGHMLFIYLHICNLLIHI